MYIIKNAMRSINRSKGRNILIGIIVVVIALSTCVSLSIKEAAKTAREDAMEGLSISAQISFDRSSLMREQSEENAASGGFDKSSMKELISNAGGLSIEEYQTYAKADSVSGFYYTSSVSLNGSGDFDAVNAVEEETTEDDVNTMRMPDNGKMQGDFGKGLISGTQGDFTVIGYSDETAMTDFASGACRITEGEIFEEGTQKSQCIISDELALLNNITAGDTITLENPNNESETIELTVIGIYNNSESTSADSSIMRFSAASDPANQIYMSYNALTSLVSGLTSDDENSAISTQTGATYLFSSIEDYEKFENEARALGLGDEYTVSSNDVSTFEQSLVPLENLSKFATYFLVVVLIIGSIILVVLNIFNVRERKYEIGVLAAMGMKKKKVAAQFITEIFTVTFIALLVGSLIGASISVPVTNALLESQITSQAEQSEQMEENFGRDDKMGNDTLENPSDNSFDSGLGDKSGNAQLAQKAVSYVNAVNSATNMTVIIELLAIGLLLTLIASAFAVIFVMRYDPIKILSERD